MLRSRKIIFVDSFFIEKLCSKGSELSNIPDGTYNYDGVKHWGKRFLKEANPMQLDAIVFFQNMQKSHWNLIVVRPKDYTIDSLDSMAMNNEVILVMIYRWLYDEIYFNYPDTLDLFKKKEWKLNDKTTMQRQQNGSDCGVFSVAWAIGISEHLNLYNMGQRSMDNARKRMLMVLLNKKMIDDISEPTDYTDAMNPDFLFVDTEMQEDDEPVVLPEIIGTDDENEEELDTSPVPITTKTLRH